MKPSIMLCNGREFDLREPDLTGYTVEHLARTLARLVRFVGHAETDVSLADHSVFVWKIACNEGLDPLVQFAALLHDAHESLCGDNSAPFKMLVPEIKPWEKLYHSAILAHFLREAGYELKVSDHYKSAIDHLRDNADVKRIDTFALHVEQICFMPQADWWPHNEQAKEWLSKPDNHSLYMNQVHDDEPGNRTYHSVMFHRSAKFLQAWAEAVDELSRSKLVRPISEGAAP